MKVWFKNLWRTATGLPLIEEQQRSPDAETNAESSQPESASSTEATLGWIGEAGGSHCLAVHVEEWSQGGMTVVSRRPIPVDQPVWLLLPKGVDFHGVVHGCQRLAESFEVAIRFSGKERPTAKPQRSLGAVRLTWMDSRGSLVHSKVSIENAEPGELAVGVSEPVPSPSVVLVAGFELQSLGSVRECRQEADSYQLSVELLGELYEKTQAKPA